MLPARLLLLLTSSSAEEDDRLCHPGLRAAMKLSPIVSFTSRLASAGREGGGLAGFPCCQGFPRAWGEGEENRPALCQPEVNRKPTRRASCADVFGS